MSALSGSEEVRNRPAQPKREIAGPTPGDGSLQARNGSGLHMLVGDFQYPLLKTQAAGVRFGRA
jgi:hypothetical protein